jgi:hypothetical protein
MKKITLLFTVFVIACFSLKAEESLQQYAAKYKFPQGSLISELNIVFDKGALSVSSTLGSSTIEKKNGDHFNLTTYKGTAVFVRNEAKRITGIKVEINGVTVEGTREEKDMNLTNLPVPIYQSTFPIKNLPAMLVEDF